MKHQKQLNINSLKHLALRLNVSESQILKVADNPQYWPAKKVVKPNGKYREFNIPRKELGFLQKQIYKKLLSTLEMPESYHGAIPRKSSKTNALKHICKETIKTYDIKSFFPSIRSESVYDVFVEELGCSPDVGAILTRLTTHNHCLPQGVSTSPFLACLSFKKSEKRIANMLKGKGITFTVYIDDLCFSSNGSTINIHNLIKSILQQSGFRINMEKYQKRGIMRRNERQEITGIVVNKKLNIQKERYRNLRGLLNNCSKNGIASQKDSYLKKYHKPLAMASIFGEISWIKSLNPIKGQNLEKLYNQIQWN